MRTLAFLALASALTMSVQAQTVVLRGIVETPAAASNQFYLGGTKLPLVSTALNLNHWVGTAAVMKVVNLGTPRTPKLLVEGAVAVKPTLTMSEMPLGDTCKLAVQAPTGATALIFLDFAANIGFTPVGSLGAWLLGSSPYLLSGGNTDADSQLMAKYPVPYNRALVGLEISSQAAIGINGGWFLTNLVTQSVKP
jgi:hypothetical protein